MNKANILPNIAPLFTKKSKSSKLLDESVTAPSRIGRLAESRD
jgi:hypothetical protein